MLEVRSLSKDYGSQPAIVDLSFRLDAGEAVAFVGPNGAGKSTLFNILAGIIKASSGICGLDGSALGSLPLQEIGFLSEEPFFYDNFTPLQTLRFEVTMRRFSKKEVGESCNAFVKQFAINGYLHERMGSLSQGMVKRVQLAAAFLGHPKLIILDEPLNALDIQSVIALKEQLAIERKLGSHILISSHVLSFLDETVDRVLFLDKGSLAAISDNNSLKAEQIYRQLFL